MFMGTYQLSYIFRFTGTYQKIAVFLGTSRIEIEGGILNRGFAVEFVFKPESIKVHREVKYRRYDRH